MGRVLFAVLVLAGLACVAAAKGKVFGVGLDSVWRGLH